MSLCGQTARLVVSGSLSRRALLGSGAAIGAVAVASPTFAAPSRGAGLSPIQRYVKMRGSLDQGLVIGFLSGRYDGVVDGDVTPLFGLAAATFARYRIQEDSCEVVSFEQAYFVDLESGARLDHFTNPYTNERVAAPITTSPPTRTRILSDLRFESPPGLPPGVHLKQWAEPGMSFGGETVVIEHVNAVAEGMPGRRPFRYTEVTTLRSAASDIDDPALARAPCQTSFEAVVSWRPWLNMGDRPGEMVGVGIGRYGARLQDLPQPWLDATALVAPELLKQPGARLDALFD